MRQPITTYITQFFLCSCLLFFVNTNLQAQLWGDQLDSLEQERLDKRRALQANPPVQERVDDEINKHRLLMLAHQWWDIPTNREQDRIDRAYNSRYVPYNTSLENSGWRNKLGVFYRSDNKISPKQNLTIMGWHPYWKGDTYKTYNYRLLTHMVYYGYEVNPFTGGYSNFEAIYDFLGDRGMDMIMTAQLDSCKVLLTVSNRGYENNEIFFTSEPDVQANLIDSLRRILIQSGADGIDLNFEEVPLAYKQNFIEFVQELSFAIREDNNNYTISMAVPIYDKDNVYDLTQLKPWVDLFVMNTFNFHIKPSELKEGPLSPLVKEDASIRGTTFLYKEYTTLDKLLSQPYDIAKVTLEHDENYEKSLKDSLNYYINWTIKKSKHKAYDLTDILNTIKITKDYRDRPLWEVPQINRILRRTNCIGLLTQKYSASNNEEGVGFFLFKPKKDTLIFKEYELFKNIGVQTEVDSHQLDLRKVVAEYKQKIGGEYASSLVLGLAYHGAVWYINRKDERDFEGYMPYSEILRLAERNQARIDYDKATHSLEATINDSLGGVYKIYFENSTSLGHKFDFAIEEGLGGVGLWALGADYAHTDLWTTIEESFVTKQVWDTERGRYDRVKVEKGNKVGFTVQYLLKRFRNLIFATLCFITIFICISFSFSVLDWKVRDILFYSGAFRIFYLVLFTVVLLVVGNWMGWFQSKTVTFAIGTCLGLLLTWAASNLVQTKHEELP